jgi:threonyl-tRNA synthetase
MNDQELEKKQKLQNIRHSLAHVLACSVRELYPGAKNAIGPAIEDGFYQDFDLPQPISDKDFKAIEKKMREVLKRWDKFECKEVSIEEAKKNLPGMSISWS